MKSAIATNNWWDMRQFEAALQCIGKRTLIGLLDYVAGAGGGAAAAVADDNCCAFGDGWAMMKWTQVNTRTHNHLADAMERTILIALKHPAQKIQRDDFYESRVCRCVYFFFN